MNNVGLLITFILTLGTAWLALARFSNRPGNNWPLLYYFALVAYLNTYDLVLTAPVVYVAVVCALLLRFEFMNARIVFFVRIVEVCALLHIGYSLFLVLQKAAR